MIKFNGDRLRVLITDMCNYSCPYCHNEGQFTTKNYLSVDDVKGIAKIIKNHNITVSSLSISGGEPSIHPQLSEIVEILSKVSSSVSIVTNGELLTKEKIYQLYNAGLKYFKFGIDNLNESNTKPQELKSKSTPSKVFDNLFYAHELLPKTSLNTVVSIYNIDKIANWIKFGETNLISIKFLEVIGVHTNAEKVKPSNHLEKAHGWFGHIYGLNNKLFKDVRYNQILKKFYATTLHNNIKLQFSEDFCYYGTCGDLWTRIDSSGNIIPCIKSPAILDGGSKLIKSIDIVNDMMEDVSNFPCKSKLVDPFLTNRGVKVFIPELNHLLDFPLTMEAGCIC